VSASAIYEGTVRHRRFRVRNREFSYPLAMVYVDLDELPSLLGGRLLRRRPGIVRFRRKDYFGDPNRPLSEEIRDLVLRRTGSRPTGPIRLLTNLRSFGHCFNPVSFYYCFDDDEQLEAVVADVTNTPWGEKHAYVLPRGQDGRKVLTGESAKKMHVSPFMGMDQRYTWKAVQPAQTASVHIDSHERGEKVFDATLALPRRLPFTRRSMARVTARFPAATLRNVILIYGHAVVMKLRRVPWYTNPNRPKGAAR
jgi:DUF1365 family protein